ISYSDRVKLEQLGVPPETLKTHGAVSAETARAMASGARELLHADLAVSITGVAGPAAEGKKPAGLTYIGIDAAGKVGSYLYQWSGDRYRNRSASVEAALKLAIEAAQTMS
ncbi:MAG TPA: CinA family protein, partial [Candidatus Dormibacteraeota bacterium]